MARLRLKSDGGAPLEIKYLVEIYPKGNTFVGRTLGLCRQSAFVKIRLHPAGKSKQRTLLVCERVGGFCAIYVGRTGERAPDVTV